jgi:hypothetical protein
VTDWNQEWWRLHQQRTALLHLVAEMVRVCPELEPLVDRTRHRVLQENPGPHCANAVRLLAEHRAGRFDVV